MIWFDLKGRTFLPFSMTNKKSLSLIRFVKLLQRILYKCLWYSKLVFSKIPARYGQCLYSRKVFKKIVKINENNENSRKLRKFTKFMKINENLRKFTKINSREFTLIHENLRKSRKYLREYSTVRM